MPEVTVPASIQRLCSLFPPAALFSEDKIPGLELDKLSPQLPSCSQSKLLSPWTGACTQEEETFFPQREGTIAPQNQCTREPSSRRGRAGSQGTGPPNEGCSQPGWHPPPFRELPLPRAGTWRQKAQEKTQEAPKETPPEVLKYFHRQERKL